jgi:uncharacterized surface protein with fasciclin (FAS1) repeats
VRSLRAVPAAVAGAVLAVSACSSGSGSPASAPASAPPSSSVAVAASPAAPGPFGPGCAGLPPSGPGSIEDLAAVPLVGAAARTPLLTHLAAALRAAHLAEALDAQRDVTVLAPANTAFEAVPAAQRDSLWVDTPRLTAVLTHHVIQGRVPPEQLAGTHTTLNNDQITIEGSGTAFTVSAADTLERRHPATVVCGNLQTANATVYLIDQVLKPQTTG